MIYPDVNEWKSRTKKAQQFSNVAHSLDAKRVFAGLANQGFLPGMAPILLIILKQIAEAIDVDHRSMLSSYDQLLERIQEVHANNYEAIDLSYKADKKKAEDEYRRRIADIDNEVDRLNARIKTIESKIDSSNRTFNNLGYFKKRRRQKDHKEEIEKFEAQITAARESRAIEESRKTRVAKSRNEAIANAKRAKTAAFEKESKAYDLEKAAAANALDEMINGLKKQGLVFFRSALPPASLVALARTLSEIRPDYSNFSPLPIGDYNEPSLFYIGAVKTTNLSVADGLAASIIRESIDGNFLALSPSCGPAIKLPLHTDLRNGLQIVLESDSDDSDWVNRKIRNLALRLLMQYPPTKLQIALIDANSNNSTFSKFESMFDYKHKYVINGGVVSHPTGIAPRIAEIRNRISGFNSGYGSASGSDYFQRESVQALFITDFPSGFTNESLADLATVMENGRSYGAVVVIGLNRKYSNKLEDNPDYQRIVSNKRVWHLVGPEDSLKRAGHDIVVQIRDDDEIEANIEAILDKLRSSIRLVTGHSVELSEIVPAILDQNAWRRKSAIKGLEIPFARSGGQKSIPLVMGRSGADSRHHALIAGTTGAGKTSVLHSIIISTILNYSADEVQLILVDLKHGSEFSEYSNKQIPSFQLISVSDNPVFAAAALSRLRNEAERRRYEGMSDYESYRLSHPNKQVPRILAIIDEVQDLFSPTVPNEVKEECAASVRWLTQEARSFGIHIILASQSFSSLGEIQSVKHNFAIRICLEKADAGGIIDDASMLDKEPIGTALFNESHGVAGSVGQAQTPIQVGRLPHPDRERILANLEAMYSEERLSQKYEHLRTARMSTYIGDDPTSNINRIAEGKYKPENTSDILPKICLGCVLLDQSDFAYSRTGAHYYTEMNYRLGANPSVLLIGRSKQFASQVFMSIALSLGVHAVDLTHSHSEANTTILFFDFTERRSDYEGNSRIDSTTITSIAALSYVNKIPIRNVGKQTFPTSSESLDWTAFHRTVDKLYETLINRQSHRSDGYAMGNDFGSIFLLLFGIDRMDGFSLTPLASGTNSKPGSGIADKLKSILFEGGKVGIYSVIWSRSEQSFIEKLCQPGDDDSGLSFARRLVFDATEDVYSRLTGLEPSPATDDAVALRDSIEGDDCFIVPFRMPEKEWFAAFCQNCDHMLHTNSFPEMPGGAQ